MSDTKEIKRRIADLETKYYHLQQVIFALVDAVKPQGVEFAMLALAYGFTAEQMEALDEFWKWASRQDKTRLTKDELAQEFEARMPQPLQGKLEQILRAERADGSRPFYCRLVLGEE